DSGSLRGAPVLVNPGDPAAPDGYLILSLADGLRACQLRVYGLPVKDAHDQPVAISPVPRVQGWPWFPPYCDGEKLAPATDAGLLGLFGIRQPRNQDSPLFPLLPPDKVRLGEGGGRPGRAQLVHAQERDFWVLANGALQKWFLSFARQDGPRLEP